MREVSSFDPVGQHSTACKLFRSCPIELGYATWDDMSKRSNRLGKLADQLMCDRLPLA